MRVPERRQTISLEVAAAVAGGVAGWFGLGPLWAIAGVLMAPAFALAGLVVLLMLFGPDPERSLRDHEPYRALTEAHRGLPTRRDMARRWPSQFRAPLADALLTQAEALCALHKETQALSPAAEAVEIYRTIAAEEPRKFTHGLAHALDRQARVLAVTGRLAEAVEAITVAIRLYGDLPPDAAAEHLPDAAEAVAHRARWLPELGMEESP